MKVPADMRKVFESEYPHNAKLKACAWCEIYHCYKLKPSFGMKYEPEVAEDAASALLESFIEKKSREAFDALHKPAKWMTWTEANGYVSISGYTVPADFNDMLHARDRNLESFASGYVQMMSDIYDEEQAQCHQ